MEKKNKPNYAGLSPLNKSRGARKAEQNERTKAAHAEATKQHWDELGAGEKVGWTDIAKSAAGAIPAAGAIAGAGKIGKLVQKVGTKVGAGNKYLGYADQAVDQLFGEGADGATVGGNAKNKAKKKAAELLMKGIAKDAAEAATMAAKALGVVGVAKAAYDTGKLINKKMYQDMTPEEQEAFRTRKSSRAATRARDLNQSPTTKLDDDRLVKDVARFEGYRGAAYEDAAGVPTIGYGRTEGVQMGDVTNRDAEEGFLSERLNKDKEKVRKNLDKWGYDYNPNQLDSLTSFAYNAGMGRLNQITRSGERSLEEVGKALLRYDKAGGKKLRGLTERRQAEYDLFNRPWAEPVSEIEAEKELIKSDVPLQRKIYTGNKRSALAKRYRVSEEDLIDRLNSFQSPLKNEDRKGQVVTDAGRAEQDYVGKLAGIAEEAPQHSERFRESYQANADKIQAQGRAERSKALQIEDEKERKKALRAAEQKEKQLLNQAHSQLMDQTKAVSDATKASAQAAKDEYKGLTSEASAWSKDHDKQLKERDKAFSDKGAQKAVAENMQTDAYKKQAQAQVADVGGNDLEAAQEKMRQQKAVPFDQMPPFKQNYIRMRKAKELGLSGPDLKSPYKVKMFLASKKMLNPSDWKKKSS